MSRSMTAAQVIALGEYLDTDFDPSTLTVSQLLGVFGFHNIRYPTPYTKPKLVQLFNDEIKPKATKFKKERLKRENSLASDDGIKDGVTGKLLNEDAKPLRRSSRRSSRAPSAEHEVKPEPSKRRRSSAQPSLGGPSTRSGPPVQPVLVEESEPEEEIVPRKVSRGKKTSEGAGTRARRVSQTLQEDSGWEDNNIFQSGAESSSPARPQPKPRSRRSAAPKATTTRASSRKAASVPPERLPPSSPPQSDDDGPAHSPPRSKFEPRLPPEVVRENDLVSAKQRTPFKSAGSPLRPMKFEETPEVDASEEEQDELESLNNADESGAGVIDDADNYEEESEDAKHTHAVSRRIADTTISRRKPAKPTIFRLRTVIILLVFCSIFYVGLPYKAESASYGFCDTNSSTNNKLEAARTRRAAVTACRGENRTLLYPPSAPSTPAITEEEQDPTECPKYEELSWDPSTWHLAGKALDVWYADTCTPCPEHAQCSNSDVTCSTGFLMRPHVLLSFLPFPNVAKVEPRMLAPPVEAIMTAKSFLLNGLPAFGPVALPVRCVEDPRRKRHIGVLGKGLEAVLGQERGRRLCAGEVPIEKDTEGGEAKRWGLEVAALREAMKEKTAPQLLDQFDDTFNEAIQQLVQWGGVITGEDSQGNRYIAHKIANLDWNCTLTVKSREFWQEYRLKFACLMSGLFAIWWIKSSSAQKKVEAKRVAELVQVALDTLRNQELSHHTDPVTAPQPYLSSLQLRDLILQDEHSVSRRRRLWDKVERVVEGNANVRANLEEVQGGDELRVWRWVGSAGRRKVQYEGAEGRVVA